LVQRKNPKVVNNLRDLGLIYVEKKKVVVILRVVDLRLVVRVTLNAEQQELHRKCLIQRKEPLANRKERPKKKTPKLVQVTNLP